MIPFAGQISQKVYEEGFGAVAVEFGVVVGVVLVVLGVLLGVSYAVRWAASKFGGPAPVYSDAEIAAYERKIEEDYGWEDRDEEGI